MVALAPLTILVLLQSCGLSHLCDYKHKHSFRDTLNLIYNCDEEIATSSHHANYLSSLSNYPLEFNSYPNILDLNNSQLTEIL